MTPRKANREAEGPRGENLPRQIPRGLEVLVKKAAVDPGFKKIFLEQRAGAAEAIGLKLTAAEEATLGAVAAAQLEGIIAHTKVTRGQRQVFLGYAAATMLAALGATVTVCGKVAVEPGNEESEIDSLSNAKMGSMRKVRPPYTAGIQPEFPEPRREGSALYVGGEAAGVETRRLADIEYRLRGLFELVEEEYDPRVKNAEKIPRGNILVKFEITADGAVESPEIINNETGFPGLGVSTLKLLKAWRFAPVKEGNATVVYRLRLNVTEWPNTGVVTMPPLSEILGGINPVAEENRVKDPYGNKAMGGTGIRPGKPRRGR
jgi:TonB family protein